MQAYELCALWSGNHTEDEVEKLSGEIAVLLESFNVSLKHTQKLTRRKLAYPIMGNTHGSYRVWLFECDGEYVKDIDKKLRLNSDVVRHLIITLDPGVIEKRIERAKEEKYAHLRRDTESTDESDSENDREKTSEAPKKPIEEPKQEQAQTKQKPSIEKLDEKLDEILESDKI